MYIYLRNKLCVNWESHLTSGFSTVNKNNLNLHLQGGSRKACESTLENVKGYDYGGSFIIYIFMGVLLLYLFFLLEYRIEYLLWFLQKKHCYYILFTFTLIPTTKGVISSEEEA